jgi:hypothetical protein
MEELLMLGQFFNGLGVLLIGVGAVWFVSMYKPREE